ncbi:heparanase-like [Ctenocephalides felis]|uniref:heparanase-like n=1 Tax=Ctenocephalides felis TaxID=7515 RepID=UPI000E6E2E5B|nr:heparanase-like [Ctenocephalides felis]
MWKNTKRGPLQTDPLLREHAFEERDPIIKEPCLCLKGLCGSFLLLFMLLLMLITCWYVSLSSIYHEEFLFTLDRNNQPSHLISKKFASFGLDTSLLGKDFGNLNLSDDSTINFIRHLAPGHLRFGGTLKARNKRDGLFDGSICSYEHRECKKPDPTDILILTGEDLLQIASFASKTGLTLLFDLNVLIRNDNGWFSKNAEDLIKFCDTHNLDINWQLGNEPNSFKHVFGAPVEAAQLAKDYKKLREILSSFPRYSRSFITGPETTRPLSFDSDSAKYMKEFLIAEQDSINVFSWHQYYMSGREAVLSNFLDPNMFNLLHDQIVIVKKIISKYGSTNMPIWISETGSAYGGGAPGLSNTFAGSFIYLDKLGLSAKLGIDVVIRQSLYGAAYTMISEQMEPLPDWWIAVLYKTFVDERVLRSQSHSNGLIRLYAHCTPNSVHVSNNATLTVFGMNLKDSDQIVRFNGALYNNMPATVRAYYVTPYKDNLQAIHAVLNGMILKLTEDGNLPEFKPILLDSRHPIYIPKYSIAFWVFHGVDFPACN